VATEGVSLCVRRKAGSELEFPESPVLPMCLPHLAADWLKYFAAAFWARCCDIGQNRSGEMLDVTTSLAFPSQGSFFFGIPEQLQRLLCVITYFFDNLAECL
jgi:hypothetical protein